jgi:hypothetical protein
MGPTFARGQTILSQSGFLESAPAEWAEPFRFRGDTGVTFSGFLRASSQYRTVDNLPTPLKLSMRPQTRYGSADSALRAMCERLDYETCFQLIDELLDPARGYHLISGLASALDSFANRFNSTQIGLLPDSDGRKITDFYRRCVRLVRWATDIVGRSQFYEPLLAIFDPTLISATVSPLFGAASPDFPDAITTAYQNVFRSPSRVSVDGVRFVFRLIRLRPDSLLSEPEFPAMAGAMMESLADFLDARPRSDSDADAVEDIMTDSVSVLFIRRGAACDDRVVAAYRDSYLTFAWKWMETEDADARNRAALWQISSRARIF